MLGPRRIPTYESAGSSQRAPLWHAIHNKNRLFSSFLHLPSIQFTREAAIFRLPRKELGHDRLGENAAVSDHEGLAVGQPANGVRVRFVIQNLVQTHRKDLGIIIFVIRMMMRGLFWVFARAHGQGGAVWLQMWGQCHE